MPSQTSISLSSSLIKCDRPEIFSPTRSPGPSQALDRVIDFPPHSFQSERRNNRHPTPSSGPRRTERLPALLAPPHTRQFAFLHHGPKFQRRNGSRPSCQISWDVAASMNIFQFTCTYLSALKNLDNPISDLSRRFPSRKQNTPYPTQSVDCQPRRSMMHVPYCFARVREDIMHRCIGP